MRKQMTIAAVVVIAVAVGIVIGRNLPSTGDPGSVGAAPGEREVLYWVAPMDSNYRRDEPGKSPMGMDLVPVYADEVDAVPGTVKIDPTVSNKQSRRAHSRGRERTVIPPHRDRRVHQFR